MLVEIIIFITTFSLAFLYFTYKERVHYFKSFERRHIPGPKPDILLGNFREMKQHKNKNIVIEKWIKQYGNIFGYFIGPRRYIIMNDIDMINQVFIKNVKYFYNREDFALDAKYLDDSVISLKDERWSKIRKILTPIFGYTKVHSGIFDPEIKKCIIEFNNEVIKKLRETKLIDLNGQKSAEIDIHNLTQAFTLDVISRTAFGIEEKIYEPNNLLMKIVKEYFQFAGNIFVEIALLVPLLRRLLTFMNNNFSSGRLIDLMTMKLKETVKMFIETQQIISSNQDNNFHLEEDTKSKLAQQKGKVLVSLIKKLADKSITEHEFIGNMLIILLAGYETTANSLTNAIYLLAKHSNIQSKLREEVLKDGIESQYLDMFWHESLRFYPPVTFFVTRKAGQDCVINGFQFLEGDYALAPVWFINRNADYWPEPDLFDPDRWEPEKRKKFHPCQFLTYGLGQKACLGSSFANYEAKLLLINVLKEFKIETCKDTPNPLEFITPTVINNPAHPVIMKFSKLENTN